MSLTVLRTMFLGLIRDRAAFLLSFALPVVFFLVFAMIFGGRGSTDSPRIEVAIGDEAGTEQTARLIQALARESALTLLGPEGEKAAAPFPRLTGDQVRTLVRSGKADAGLILREGAGASLALFGGSGEGPAPVIVIEDSSRKVASQILLGLVQKALFSGLPDMMAETGIQSFEKFVSPLTGEQRRRFDQSVAQMRSRAEGEGGSGGFSMQGLAEVEQVTGKSAGQSLVAYYAGAVAVMFLLFSAAHAAASLLEEREAGILERVLAGPGGIRPLLIGKFLFLVALGFLQVVVIFVVAWLVYGVDLPGHLAGFTAATAGTAAAGAGLALLLATACRTPRQASALATILILVLSAIGGSMVPRFIMPPLFQKLGWLTPNTWALEAYTKVFWRDEPLAGLALPVGLLAGVALAATLLAFRLARRWETV